MSNMKYNFDAEHHQVIENAAKWFSRMRSSVCSEETKMEFHTWLEQDPVHVLAYEQCKTIWVMSGELQKDDEVGIEIASARKAANPIHENKQNILGTIRNNFTHGLARVAAIALLIGSVVFINHKLSPDKYYTEIGEQRLLVLPDGSSAMLNTDTVLFTKFTGQIRYIELEKGEAYFDVKSDNTRPFEVHATGSIVRAVGTEFNVAIRDQEVAVAVLEGAVIVSAEHEDNTTANLTEIAHGQTVVYREGGALSPVETVDIDRISAWRDRKIYFKSDRLEDAITEYNRYTMEKIVIESESLKEHLVTGVFSIRDAESFIFALQQTFDISIVYHNNSILIKEKK